MVIGTQIVDLRLIMADSWATSHKTPYPGNPYNHDHFGQHHSDHHPVFFTLTIPLEDDDG